MLNFYFIYGYTGIRCAWHRSTQQRCRWLLNVEFAVKILVDYGSLIADIYSVNAYFVGNGWLLGLYDFDRYIAFGSHSSVIWALYARAVDSIRQYGSVHKTPSLALERTQMAANCLCIWIASLKDLALMFWNRIIRIGLVYSGGHLKQLDSVQNIRSFRRFLRVHRVLLSMLRKNCLGSFMFLWFHISIDDDDDSFSSDLLTSQQSTLLTCSWVHELVRFGQWPCYRIYLQKHSSNIGSSAFICVKIIPFVRTKYQNYSVDRSKMFRTFEFVFFVR